MAATVLGISGSPVPDSNTDRAVRAVCEATGEPYEFIKLSKLHMEPCRACLGCTRDNRCVVQDDAQTLADKFRACKAFVLGGFTPYSSLDARTKMFMERMYCLRHQTGLNRGKLGVTVITTAVPEGQPHLPPASETAVNQIAYWMMEEGMENLGALVILGNVPCIRCGHGDDCSMSGIQMLQGPNATVHSVGVNRFHEDERATHLARQLGQRIHDRLKLGVTTPLPVH